MCSPVSISRVLKFGHNRNTDKIRCYTCFEDVILFRVCFSDKASGGLSTLKLEHLKVNQSKNMIETWGVLTGCGEYTGAFFFTRRNARNQPSKNNGKQLTLWRFPGHARGEIYKVFDEESDVQVENKQIVRENVGSKCLEKFEKIL